MKLALLLGLAPALAVLFIDIDWFKSVDDSHGHGAGDQVLRTIARPIQATIDTGHLLGASITAEGVETDRQARELTAMGADRLQGFGLGFPMAAAELRSWIEANVGFLGRVDVPT